MDPQLLNRWDRNPTAVPEEVARGTKLLEKDLVLFPTYQDAWTLLAARPRRKEILAFDPCARTRAVEMQKLIDFFEVVSSLEGVPFEREAWVTCETPDGCPPAPNHAAAAVCVYGDKLSREAGMTGFDLNPRQATRRIGRLLRARQFEQEDFADLDAAPETPEASPPTVEVSVAQPNPPATQEMSLSDMELDQEINSRMAQVRIEGTVPSTSESGNVTGFVAQIPGASAKDPLHLVHPGMSSSVLSLTCSEMTPPPRAIDEERQQERDRQAAARRRQELPEDLLGEQPPLEAIGAPRSRGRGARRRLPPRRRPQREADRQPWWDNRRQRAERSRPQDPDRRREPARRGDRRQWVNDRRDNRQRGGDERRRDNRRRGDQRALEPPREVPHEGRQHGHPPRTWRDRRGNPRQNLTAGLLLPPPNVARVSRPPVLAARRPEENVVAWQPPEGPILRVQIQNPPRNQPRARAERQVRVGLPHELLNIPEDRVRWIAAHFEQMTPEQRRNKCWRIAVGDNAFVRVRSAQMARLLEVRGQPPPPERQHPNRQQPQPPRRRQRRRR